MAVKILYFVPSNPAMRQMIQNAADEGFEISFLESVEEDEVRAKLAEAEMLIVGAKKLEAWHIEAAPKLRLVLHQGVGYHDTVATDVARLLGSMAGNHMEARQQGLLAYQEVRPLTVTELELVECFDQANVILSPLNWLQWLLVERRQFADLSLVWQRLDELIERFPRHG